MLEHVWFSHIRIRFRLYWGKIPFIWTIARINHSTLWAHFDLPTACNCKHASSLSEDFSARPVAPRLVEIQTQPAHMSSFSPHHRSQMLLPGHRRASGETAAEGNLAGSSSFACSFAARSPLSNRFPFLLVLLDDGQLIYTTSTSRTPYRIPLRITTLPDHLCFLERPWVARIVSTHTAKLGI